MMHTIYTGTFSVPPVQKAEILRYAGAREATPELSALLEEALAEAAPCLTYRVCWQKLPIIQNGTGLDLTFARTQSEALRRHLQGCSHIILFGATVGIGLDRLIARYGKTAPAKALLLQAIGAERIEALCNAFSKKIKQDAAPEGLCTTSRFSPGYGDLPLELQRDIFRSLNCSGKIGLTLNESLMMSPSKSVTAIIGIGSCCQDTAAGCSGCAKSDCIHRRSL
ncbi:MAG: Vitamin B12 dependent methionine synthase activation subunit [Oscillospiraceae bacterium]|nr:Vitamin B12 dependent methionine synthase activation subunit [Oscillospiraceae bacterium]